MTGEFFHSNEIELVNSESDDSASNLVSLDINSENLGQDEVPGNDIARTLFDHIIDQEVPTNQEQMSESDSSSNAVEDQV